MRHASSGNMRTRVPSTPTLHADSGQLPPLPAPGGLSRASLSPLQSSFLGAVGAHVRAPAAPALAKPLGQGMQHGSLPDLRPSVPQQDAADVGTHETLPGRHRRSH